VSKLEAYSRGRDRLPETYHAWQVFGAGNVGDWHHYALVWDKNGLPEVGVDVNRGVALREH
jgi:hypothetical protein